MNGDNENVFIDEAVERIDGYLTRMIACAIIFAIGMWAGVSYERHNTTTPVESNNIIDSLTTINDSIKIKVEKLDSIKDAKVIEVSTLDNDSTLKLFYELVSE